MARPKATLPVVDYRGGCCWCGRWIEPDQIRGIRSHSLGDLEPKGKCVEFEVPAYKRAVVGYLTEKDSDAAREIVEKQGTDILFFVCSLECEDELMQALIPMKVFSN